MLGIIASWDNSREGNDCYIEEVWTIEEFFGDYLLRRRIKYTGWCASTDEQRYDLKGSESDMQKQVNNLVGHIIKDLQYWEIERCKIETHDMDDEEYTN